MNYILALAVKLIVEEGWAYLYIWCPSAEACIMYHPLVELIVRTSPFELGPNYKLPSRLRLDVKRYDAIIILTTPAQMTATKPSTRISDA